METLHVFLFGRLAGVLSLEKRDFIFEYTPDYLSSSEASPLSATLPLHAGKHDPATSKSFFSNLLPEGDLRSLIARDRKISIDNDFALLKEIGGECAGAISLLPPETGPDQNDTYEEIPDHVLSKMIASASVTPLLTQNNELRLSLAGAQNKIPLLYRNGAFHAPKGNAPSNHILKIASKSFPDLIENEYVCMKLAEKVGLLVPETFIWRDNGQKAIVIERYDRFLEKDGSLLRLHQEDFCQALGVMPDRKYENEGGPGYKACAEVICKCCSIPAKDKTRLAEWAIFNFLIGNCDAHAKNISLLYNRGQTTLAPFYDLVSTLIYPELSSKMAMHIGGKSQGNYLFPVHWERLADDLGLGSKQFAKLAQVMAEKVIGGMEAVVGENEEMSGMGERILGVVRLQSKRLPGRTL